MLDVNYLQRYRVNGKYGLLYSVSKIKLTGPIYDDVRKINGTINYLKVLNNSKWGIIDCSAKLIFDYKYDDVLNYINHCFRVYINGNYISEEYPKIVKPPYPDSYYDHSDYGNFGNLSNNGGYTPSIPKWPNDGTAWDFNNA